MSKPTVLSHTLGLGIFPKRNEHNVERCFWKYKFLQLSIIQVLGTQVIEFHKLLDVLSEQVYLVRLSIRHNTLTGQVHCMPADSSNAICLVAIGGSPQRDSVNLQVSMAGVNGQRLSALHAHGIW